MHNGQSRQAGVSSALCRGILCVLTLPRKRQSNCARSGFAFGAGRGGRWTGKAAAFSPPQSEADSKGENGSSRGAAVLLPICHAHLLSSALLSRGQRREQALQAARVRGWVELLHSIALFSCAAVRARLRRNCSCERTAVSPDAHRSLELVAAASLLLCASRTGVRPHYAVASLCAATRCGTHALSSLPLRLGLAPLRSRLCSLLRVEAQERDQESDSERSESDDRAAPIHTATRVQLEQTRERREEPEPADVTNRTRAHIHDLDSTVAADSCRLLSARHVLRCIRGGV